jgi:Putative beta-barrel porin-2, OmpL-like. bbp2
VAAMLLPPEYSAFRCVITPVHRSFWRVPMRVSFLIWLTLLATLAFREPAYAQEGEAPPPVMLQPHLAMQLPGVPAGEQQTVGVVSMAQPASTTSPPSDIIFSNAAPVANAADKPADSTTGAGAANTLIAGASDSSAVPPLTQPAATPITTPPPQGPALLRFLKSYTGGASATPLIPSPPRRGAPPALDPVFPSTEFLGVASQLPIGVPDAGAQYPLEKYLWRHCPELKKLRIRIYGWNDAGMAMVDTSRRSNFPESYLQVPRQPVMNQQITRIERVPDTVQKEHMDWGFRATSLWGQDYRFTTALGFASDQLLSDNRLYGWDPVELYGTLYIPKVAQGMVVKVGRFISPPDIEAQLAPDNYLYSHSLMFTFDAYTYTGVNTTIQLNNQWAVTGGFHAGNDMAPWSKGAVPSGQFMLRWVAKNNKDSIYGGIPSINNGYYRMTGQHTNLNQANITWTHVFNKRVHTMTEAYFIYERDALAGGTVINGPPRFFFKGVGPGRFLPGLSSSIGAVNYTNFKITNKDYISIRPLDYLDDCRGAMTGFSTPYMSWTIGWAHRFSDTLMIRPEIRGESALRKGVNPYDNGTKHGQFTIACDMIQRF